MHSIQKVGDFDKFIDEVNVVGIDEGQFYPDLLEKAEEYAHKDKIVIISALDGTFER